MKRTYTIIVIVALVMLTMAGTIGFLINTQDNEAQYDNQGYIIQDFEGGGDSVSTCNLAASTSPILLEPNDSTSTDSYVAGTSLICRVGSARNARLNLYAVASTTATKYNWTIYYGNDVGDWYPEETASTTQAVSYHSNSALSNSWTPGGATGEAKSILLTDITTQWIRFDFDVDTASGSLSGFIQKR